ncbi:MAG: tetratricopeptide repeat protein, partial [Alphaproteobacteria bacterium]|nr:tetratricopeptide repeat protein [Alphaproteobacteria bacterium]
QDPENTGWQRDLSVGHDRIGDVLRAQGDLTGAAKSYGASLEIRKRLSARDLDNTGWQRDLSVSHEKIGEVLWAQGDQTGAIQAYEQSASIAQSLADRFPDHPQFVSEVVGVKQRLEALRMMAP